MSVYNDTGFYAHTHVLSATRQQIFFSLCSYIYRIFR